MKYNVLVCELTSPEAGGPTPTGVPDLLDQINTSFISLMGDGAFDGEPVSQAVLNGTQCASSGTTVPKPSCSAAETHSETIIFNNC